MLIPVLLFIVGLLFLIKGGDWFVDGASSLARRFHLPELLIGATVVSIGTTLPEVMVSTMSALSGHGEIAYGNAIGSVICNAALIAAITIAVFLAFFGHGPSGPIVRYGQQAPQLDPGSETRRVSADRFCYGIKRLVLGLAKKAIIADQLALIYAKAASVPAATLPAPILVLGYTAYMMQLYFDFSGYSDMAIGIGEFFGITLPENFAYPYLACSVGEYWRRWHISLSSWFRDYVYIPLGGSRCRLRRTCLNLLIVFALTGLWHGAAWQYVVFGLLHGIILCMERLGLRRALEQLPRLFRHLYTVVLLWLTLVIFGAPGLSEGLAVLKGIFTWQSGAKGYTLAAFADTKLLLILAASFLLCGPVQALCPKLKAALYAKKAPSPAGMAGLLVLLFLGLMRVTAGTYSAFIYFQF